MDSQWVCMMGYIQLGYHDWTTTRWPFQGSIGIPGIQGRQGKPGEKVTIGRHVVRNKKPCDQYYDAGWFLKFAIPFNNYLQGEVGPMGPPGNGNGTSGLPGNPVSNDVL